MLSTRLKKKRKRKKHLNLLQVALRPSGVLPVECRCSGPVDEAHRKLSGLSRAGTGGIGKPVSFTAEDEEVIEKPSLVWQRKLLKCAHLQKPCEDIAQDKHTEEQDQVQDPEHSVQGIRRQEVALMKQDCDLYLMMSGRSQAGYLRRGTISLREGLQYSPRRSVCRHICRRE